jgi:hypothetical protein
MVPEKHNNFLSSKSYNSIIGSYHLQYRKIAYNDNCTLWSCTNRVHTKVDYFYFENRYENKNLFREISQIKVEKFRRQPAFIGKQNIFYIWHFLECPLSNNLCFENYYCCLIWFCTLSGSSPLNWLVLKLLFIANLFLIISRNFLEISKILRYFLFNFSKFCEIT